MEYNVKRKSRSNAGLERNFSTEIQTMIPIQIEITEYDQARNVCKAKLQNGNIIEIDPFVSCAIPLTDEEYYVIIMDTHIKIGCKLYKHTEWENFTDDEIAAMDEGALEWWNEWRGMILSLSLSHQQRIAKLR